MDQSYPPSLPLQTWLLAKLNVFAPQNRDLDPGVPTSPPFCSSLILPLILWQEPHLISLPSLNNSLICFRKLPAKNAPELFLPRGFPRPAVPYQAVTGRRRLARHLPSHLYPSAAIDPANHHLCEKEALGSRQTRWLNPAHLSLGWLPASAAPHPRPARNSAARALHSSQPPTHPLPAGKAVREGAMRVELGFPLPPGAPRNPRYSALPPARFRHPTTSSSAGRDQEAREP